MKTVILIMGLIAISGIAFSVYALLARERKYLSQCYCMRNIIDQRERNKDDIFLIAVFMSIQCMLLVVIITVFHQKISATYLTADLLLWATTIAMDLVLFVNTHCAFRRAIASMKLRRGTEYCKVKQGSECPQSKTS